MMRIWSLRIAAVALLALVTQGCMVRATDYKTLQEQYADAQAQNYMYQNTLSEYQARLQESESRYKNTQAELDAKLAATQAGHDVSPELARIWDSLERLATQNRGEMTWDADKQKLLVSVEFESGSATVKTGSKDALRKIAGVLKQLNTDHMVYVDGHTDNVPVRQPDTLARFGDNDGLAMARAISVQRQLREEGVPPRLMITRGFGPHHPVADNSTPEGRAKNRRVEIAVVPSPSASRPAGALTPELDTAGR